MIFVSYYTLNTPYEEVAKRYLIPSLERFKLNYVVEAIKNLGNWYKNTAYKAKFILEKLKLYNEVVYIDVDAEIREFPELFFNIPEEYSFACHFLNWNDFYGYKHNPPVLELLTGTLFIRNNPNTRQLCEEWYEKSINSYIWEQKVLQQIINNYNIKIFKLPIEYCYIATKPDGNEPNIKVNKPVIVHYQKSREFKKFIDKFKII